VRLKYTCVVLLLVTAAGAACNKSRETTPSPSPSARPATLPTTWDKSRFTSVALVHNGMRVIGTGAAGVVAFDTRSRARQWQHTFNFECDLVSGSPVSVARDGAVVAAGLNDTVVVLDGQTGGIVHKYQFGEGLWSTAVALSPNGEVLAAGGQSRPGLVVVDRSTGNTLLRVDTLWTIGNPLRPTRCWNLAPCCGAPVEGTIARQAGHPAGERVRHEPRLQSGRTPARSFVWGPRHRALGHECEAQTLEVRAGRYLGRV
jgi:hypothetical protein